MPREKSTRAVRPTHKNTKTPWHVALYIRLSKEDGNDESLSVTNQRKILLDYLEQTFIGDYLLVDSFVDDGASGTDYERPAFQRMLREIEAGGVNCVICKNLSRAFRNYADQGYFLEHFFPLHNTRFVTLGDPKVDSFLHPEVVQGLEVPINGLLNDRYAAKTSQDVRRTFDIKRKNGEFIGAFAPFGYCKSIEDKNRFQIDEEAAALVREIFRLYVQEGMSKTGIAKHFNEMGISNPTSYKRNLGLRYHSPTTQQNDGLWSSKTIRDILCNQVYIGHMVQGKQRVISYKVHDRISTPQDEWYVVENTHAAIIDQKTFEMAQTLSQRDTRVAPNSRALYLFSGFVRCADCGKAMTRRTSKGHVYYACRTYQEKDKTRCTKHTIRMDALEAATLVAIQVQIALTEAVEGIIQTIKNTPSVRTQGQRPQKQYRQGLQEVEQLRSIKDDLYIDWKTGELSHEEFRRMRTKLQAQIEQLERSLALLQHECEQADREDKLEDPYLTHFLAHHNVNHLVRGILVELVKDILVHENGAIEIQFTFADPYRRILADRENRFRE